MVIIDPSRNRARPVGEPFTDAVDLAGWEDQSIWGYDLGTATYFAQLWRNTTRGGDPDIWLSGISPTLSRPECVALAIVERLKIDALTVVKALAIADPNPQVRPFQEVLVNTPLGRKDVYGKAVGIGLSWVAGVPTSEKSPGSWLDWRGGCPTAAEVDAEHSLVTARIYRGQDREAYEGIDLALWWALEGTDDLLV